jgi:hypothetical protein
VRFLAGHLIQLIKEISIMNTLAPVASMSMRTLYKIGYLIVAVFALAPLFPVINLMYLAKWIHGDDAENALSSDHALR